MKPADRRKELEKERMHLLRRLDEVTAELASDGPHPEKDVTHMLLLEEEIRAVHHRHLSFLQAVTARLSKNEYSKVAMVDLGFLCREIEELTEDWRKDCKARKELFSKVLAFQVITHATAKPDEADDSVRGQLATGTVNSEVQPKLPKRGDPDFERVLEYFGLPKSLAETGVVKLDWEAARRHVTELIASGKTPPPGLDKTYPVYSTTYRRRSSSKH